MRFSYLFKYVVFLIFAFGVLAQGSLARAEGMSLAASQGPDQYAQISIIPEKTQIEAGETIYIAIQQDIYPKWHTYWKNPGDSGEPTHVNWDLPDGFQIGDLEFPVPIEVPTPPLTNYGYEGVVTYLQTLTAPEILPQGPIVFAINVDWLVCFEICIPESGSYTLVLNEGELQDNTEIITDAMNKMPTDLGWVSAYKEENGMLITDIDVEHPRFIGMEGQTVRLDLLPLEWGVIKNGSQPMTHYREKSKLRIAKERGDRDLPDLGAFEALLILETERAGRSAVRVTMEPDAEWLASSQAAAAAGNDAAAKSNKSKTSLSLLTALAFAFLGGLILNLMPCVFPILSMKALSLCRMAEKSKSAARGYGFAYTAGILVGFGAIAIIIIALKQTGADIGWGFQLQNPLIILGIALILYLVGLNLSGFFEIKGGFSNVGSSLANRQGVSGSFFTGLLAVIVATPCTAPFMGVAMGFALVQPPAIALSVFLILGFGLAFPFLLISIVPAFQRILPKPGVWMITFREFLAFPIYASVVWLVWVLAQQTGSAGVLWALTIIVGFTFVIWIFGKTRWASIGGFVIRTLGVIAVIGTIVVAGFALTWPQATEANYSEKTYESYIAGDAPVFVNMTADWCVTCKVNERVALYREGTRDLFDAHSVVYLKGDWTKKDAAITKYLERYGRNGVPLYVYYGTRNAQTGERPEPVILPQILTPGIIADLFEN